MESGARKARLVETRALTYDTHEYLFEMVEPESMRFRAGQFVSIACGEDAQGALLRRSYSIASSSAVQTHFTLVVKLLPSGLASLFFRALAPGSEIEFTGPMGFFVLELQHPGDVVFGATGTGLAPVVPMLEELFSRPAQAGRLLLYLGMRTLEDLFYADKLDALARANRRFVWELCLTRPPPGWAGGHASRITPLVLDTVGRLADPTYYLVGNGDMIKDLRRLLQERGIDRRRRIRTEAFFAATP